MSLSQAHKQNAAPSFSARTTSSAHGHKPMTQALPTRTQTIDRSAKKTRPPRRPSIGTRILSVRVLSPMEAKQQKIAARRKVTAELLAARDR